MARKNPKRKSCGGFKKTLEKMNYALVGETSAVQICRWTKNSLRGEGCCWKEKFYGIKSHRCCQMSPAVMWCENQCLHCWRPIEINLGTDLPGVDDPIEILDVIIEARKKLLMGFKGREGIDQKKFEEAINPNMFTFSLSGEPTIYPRLGEMISEIRRREAVSFLVTNGLNPEAIQKLANEDSLPTQITVSTNAPNEELFKIWHRSTKVDAWKKFNETLDVVRSLKDKVRRVIRLTLVKPGSEDQQFKNLTNMSDENVGDYVSLINKAEPDFVHIKGFMSVGYARDRMGYDKQPWFDDVKEYAKKIAAELDGYEIAAEDERSCVIMLAREGTELKIVKV